MNMKRIVSEHEVNRFQAFLRNLIGLVNELSKVRLQRWQVLLQNRPAIADGLAFSLQDRLALLSVIALVRAPYLRLTLFHRAPYNATVPLITKLASFG